MLTPFFPDRSRAEKSTQRVARVIAIKGRAFLEGSRGSTLILNPEEPPCCILYPEEVVLLLDESHMARVDPLSVDEEVPFACCNRPGREPQICGAGSASARDGLAARRDSELAWIWCTLTRASRRRDGSQSLHRSRFFAARRSRVTKQPTMRLGIDAGDRDAAPLG